MLYITFNLCQFLINDLHNISIMYMYDQSSVIDRKGQFSLKLSS